MRVFSYLFHGLLALFMLAISVVALSTGQTIHLRMLPWQGRSLAYWLFFSALAGLISLLLAVRGTWRGLFFLWSLAVLVVLIRGYFFSSYYFRGQPAFYHALYLLAGALIAAFGAWFQLRRERIRR
jgi:hypothetical protein